MLVFSGGCLTHSAQQPSVCVVISIIFLQRPLSTAKNFYSVRVALLQCFSKGCAWIAWREQNWVMWETTVFPQSSSSPNRLINAWYPFKVYTLSQISGTGGQASFGIGILETFFFFFWLHRIQHYQFIRKWSQRRYKLVRKKIKWHEPVVSYHV